MRQKCTYEKLNFDFTPIKCQSNYYFTTKLITFPNFAILCFKKKIYSRKD